MKREGNLRWSQMILAANTPMLLRAGLVEGRLDAGVLSSGQAVGVIEDLPTVADLVARVVSEAEATLKRLGELS
jgi:NAD(P)H-dependent flavin oxidoreductase YrpB (nitropropane dioxygenase family)